jgi:hypothetical protein
MKQHVTGQGKTQKAIAKMRKNIPVQGRQQAGFAVVLERNETCENQHFSL